ncbi:zinc-binding dehydrogenase [Micromonospora sp. NPDC051300]|uniref:zinc-binding dehydrogenase n=1 Tax=Micromonospora sp. NPDC051300 TaxID=3364286 RepID=UPI00379ED73B
MTTAVIFTGVNAVEIVDQPDPTPGPGEFVVSAHISLISPGTEGICLGRLFDPGTHWDAWVRYPFAPGYSLVGTVTETGAGVTRVRPGDRVAVRKPHASQVLVTEKDDVYPVPPAVSDEDAAWFHLATIAQVGVRRAAHRLGDRVAVVGLGPVGQLAVRYARLGGADDVFAVDPVGSRVDAALAGGATAGFVAPVAEAVAAIRDSTGGRGVDVVYDVTGAAAVFSCALGALTRFGRLVLLGDTGRPAEQRLSKEVIVEGLTVVGAHDMHGEFTATDQAPWNNLRMGELFLRYVERGDMTVGDLVTHRVPAAEAARAYDLVTGRDPSAMGIILDWTPDSSGR